MIEIFVVAINEKPAFSFGSLGISFNRIESGASTVAIMSGVEAPLPPVVALKEVLAGAAVHLNHGQDGKNSLNDENGLQQQVDSSQAIDPRFIFPEEERTSTPHDLWDVDLPVIDLAPVLNLRGLRKEIDQQQADSEARRNVEKAIEQCEASRERVEREIRAACEECGFLQIVNHGFPMEVVEKLTESARQIFDLPLEEKMKARQIPATTEKPLKSGGYNPMIRSPTYRLVGKLSWNETFDMDFPEVLYPGQLEDNVTSLWPEEPERTSKGLQLRSVGEEYAKHANSLSVLVLDLMAASLGLPKGTMQKFLGGGRQAHLEARCNVAHYPICPQPESTLGVMRHTDPSLITLLHQDAVGGLQVRFRDGTWHGVRPVPGAFVVNVGNLLQAVTNGRFISAEHRAVTNKKADRFSIVYFVLDDMESVFSPRPELVDAQHPLLYRPFSRREYLQALREYGRVSEKRIDNFTEMFRHQNQPE